MTTYVLTSWTKRDLKDQYRLYRGDIAGARRLACKLLKENTNITGRIVIRSKTIQGEVDADRDRKIYEYVSYNSKEGIYWRINPKTGMLTRKIGYVE